MKTIKEILEIDLENKHDAITADELREGFMTFMADKQVTEKDKAVWLVERDKVRVTKKQKIEALELMKEYQATLN